jgi:hypothetical protein
MDIKDLNNKIEMLESKINQIQKNESDKRIDLFNKILMLEKVVIKNKSARMTQIETIESKYNELGVNCKGLLKLVEDGFNKVSSTTKYLEDKIEMLVNGFTRDTK